jgi:transposase
MFALTDQGSMSNTHQEAPMYYSGIDLHKDNSYITTVDDTGEIVKQERLHNVPDLIIGYFASLAGPHKAVVECTTGWYWLNDLLETQGIDLILAHAKYLKAISYAKVKTDKVDSLTLARILRLDSIPAAHKISRQLRDLRDLMRSRLRLVQKRTSCYISIANLGRKLNCPDELIVAERAIPASIPEPSRLQLKNLYAQIDLLNTQILELEHFLQPTLIPNDDIQRLLWIPGMGKITAFTVYLEADGIERFLSDKHFVSYCRLVPGAKNSNRTSRHKSGCKDGNKYLKIAFSDMAVHAIQYYPEYRRLYQKILRRSNQPIARTVVAKELARIVYFILKNKTDYRGLKGQPISRQKAAQYPRLKRSPAATPGKPVLLTDAQASSA